MQKLKQASTAFIESKNKLVVKNKFSIILISYKYAIVRILDIKLVPFVRAKPSFDNGSNLSIFASYKALLDDIISLLYLTFTVGMPIIAVPKRESWAKSPEAPNDPLFGTIGITFLFIISTSVYKPLKLV